MQYVKKITTVVLGYSFLDCFPASVPGSSFHDCFLRRCNVHVVPGSSFFDCFPSSVPGSSFFDCFPSSVPGSSFSVAFLPRSLSFFGYFPFSVVDSHLGSGCWGVPPQTPPLSRIVHCILEFYLHTLSFTWFRSSVTYLSRLWLLGRSPQTPPSQSNR